MRRRRFEPVFLVPGAPPEFPDPRRADAEGLVAFGGDLSVARLELAYRSGLFPWYEADIVPLWWSPDPRCVFRPERLHVSRRLARTIRRGDFSVTWNRCFRRVMAECAAQRDDGTWIFDEMLDAYVALHERGSAHSLEVWRGDELVGGLYGVQVGALFAAESKFHRQTDMSKVALVAAVRSLFRAGIEVFDVQMPTEHLTSLGASAIARAEYLDSIAIAVDRHVDLTSLSLSCDVGG